VIVVVDSGIWISAIEFGGTPAVALERLFLIDDLAICSDIEDEVLRVLHDKFGRDCKLISCSRLVKWPTDTFQIQHHVTHDKEEY
jgi:hypothetical protein